MVGHVQHVGAYSRSGPDAKEHFGATGFGAAGTDRRPFGGGSVIYVMRRRLQGSRSDPFGEDRILEGGSGFSGPSRSFGSSPSAAAASPRVVARPRLDINADKQARHVTGTQTDPGRGTLQANPDALMAEFAGRGRVITGSRPGVGGTKESFDTGDRVIGIYRHKDGRSAPTTRGSIIYSGTGAHIVPIRLSGWVE